MPKLLCHMGRCTPLLVTHPPQLKKDTGKEKGQTIFLLNTSACMSQLPRLLLLALLAPARGMLVLEKVKVLMDDIKVCASRFSSPSGDTLRARRRPQPQTKPVQRGPPRAPRRQAWTSRPPRPAALPPSPPDSLPRTLPEVKGGVPARLSHRTRVHTSERSAASPQASREWISKIHPVWSFMTAEEATPSSPLLSP